MNAFFVAFVVFGCALSAQSECVFKNGGNGGVLDDAGDYKEGKQYTSIIIISERRLLLQRNSFLFSRLGFVMV